MKGDPLLERILAFDRARGGGVAVNRVNRGYSLFNAETGKPIARLRPTGRADEVEILWWRGDRWDRIGDFGGIICRSMRPSITSPTSRCSGRCDRSQCATTADRAVAT
jgi:hypothetical protein